MLERIVNEGSASDAFERLKGAHWEINSLMLPQIVTMVWPSGIPDYQPAPITAGDGGTLFGLPVTWTQRPGITLVPGKVEGGEG